MKIRLKKVIKNIIIILALGTVYAGLCLVTGISIPCPIKLTTGLYCPGCGVSRMCLSIIKLDFQSAYHYNQCVFILSPFIIILLIITGIKYVITGSANPGIFIDTCLYIIIFILISFGIWRNLS